MADQRPLRVKIEMEVLVWSEAGAGVEDIQQAGKAYLDDAVDGFMGHNPHVCLGATLVTTTVLQ